MMIDNSRRAALAGFRALAVGAAALATGPSRAATQDRIIPPGASHEAVAAELTNHLIGGLVLTPGIVATIPELQQAGSHYAT